MIFGGIADDLTGGLELAAMLAEAGVRTVLSTIAGDEMEAPETDALVIAQKTRVAPLAELARAVEAAAEALQKRDVRQIFFKYCATFDSTAEGNIGPASDIIMARTGAEFTAFCPTFPEYRRAVFQGHLFVGDRLVSESPKKDDPLTPMTDPDLVRVLQRQTKRKVGLIDQSVVRKGESAISERRRQLTENGTSYAIADAACHDDLIALARASVAWPVMTGGSSIAAHYPLLWRQRGWLGPTAHQAPIPSVRGPSVVLSGSCATQTLDQLQHFGAAHPVLTLKMEELARGDEAIERAIAWARARLDDGPVAIATSASPQDVAHVQATLGVSQAARLAEEALGRIAVELWGAGVRRFVVAGGETAGAVLAHMKVTRLRVGPFVGPSLPVAVAEDRDLTAFCLKSGKLGREDAFAQALIGMERAEGSE
jgi:3-dehydrotetronate 4-kinase